jgi:hypothetical protein
MHGGWAKQWQERLTDLLEQHPQVFQTLRALVEGRKSDADSKHVKSLKKWAFLRHDETVLPDVEAVLPAVYRETLDGPCIVDPFELKTPEDTIAAAKLNQWLDTAEMQGQRAVLQELRRRKGGSSERGQEGQSK